ncbi:MAG TPA: cytochrome b [Sphingomonas sp.]|jgi:cytochrome b561|uniref:cytochrome b n=1 Tax=Sphingomonas sp. TaxID=28214 RepID=UPI002ED84DC4
MDETVGGDSRYTRVAIALHWTMAALIIFNLIVGLAHDVMEKAMGASPIPLHKSIGLTVLALAFVRIGWRWTHRPPPLPAGTPARERRIAHAVHILLYGLMLIMPMTGWILSSAGKYPLNWFGLFAVPKFAVMKGAPIATASNAAHYWLGLMLVALVIGHMLAALRHHFLLRDTVLRRMIG